MKRALLLSLLIVAVVVVAAKLVGGDESPDDPRSALTKLDTAFAAGDWNAVVEGATRLIAAEEKNRGQSAAPSDRHLIAQAWLVRAHCSAARFEESIDAGRDLVVLTTERFGSESQELAISLRELANTFVAAGRHADAKTYYERSAAINPTDPAVLLGLGIVERRTGDVDKALAYYDRALSIYESKGEPQSRRDVFALLTSFENLAAEVDREESRRMLVRARAAFGSPFGHCLLGTNEGVEVDLLGWQRSTGGHGHCTWAYADPQHPEWLIRLTALECDDFGEATAEQIVQKLDSGLSSQRYARELNTLDDQRALHSFWITDAVGARNNRVYFWYLVQRLQSGRNRCAWVSLSILEEASTGTETNNLIQKLGEQIRALRFPG